MSDGSWASQAHHALQQVYVEGDLDGGAQHWLLRQRTHVDGFGQWSHVLSSSPWPCTRTLARAQQTTGVLAHE